MYSITLLILSIVFLKCILDIVREAQLRSYGQFMEDFAGQLQEIENALDDHKIGEAWDYTFDPISLQVKKMVTF